MKRVFLSVCWLLSVAVAESQPNSPLPSQNSLRNMILDRQARQMEQLRALLIADSLKRVELTKQLSELKSTENLKKEELLAELNAVKAAEANRLRSQKAGIDMLRTLIKGFPVVLGQDTIFLIYNRLGSFSAQERAQAIAARLEKLAESYYFSPDSLQLFPSGAFTDIAYGEAILMSVTDSDGLWAGASREDLALRNLRRIGESVSRHREATSWRTLATEAGLAVLVLCALALLMRLIGRLFRWTRYRICAQRHRWFSGIRLKDYQVVDADRQVNVLITLNTLLKWVAMALAVYLALPVLFSIFPWTSHFTDTLLELLLFPIRKIFQAVWLYLPNLFTIGVIVVFFHYFLKAVRFLKNAVEAGSVSFEGFPPPTGPAPPTRSSGSWCTPSCWW